MKLNCSFLFVAVFVITPLASTLAQTPPDAGVLQQQIERERKPALPPSAIPIRPTEPTELKSTARIKVTVTAFRFAGNTLLSSDALTPVVAEYLNRPLDFSELQQAAAAIATAYRKAGWIVRTYLPKQDVSEGVVIIQVVEAVFGGAQLEGTPPLRVEAARLLVALAAAQPMGAPINANKLDRSLLLLDDLPGVMVSGSLKKGQGENETDLVLRTIDEPFINGEVGIDNTGSRATGAGRATGALYLNSPLGFGDQAIANVIHSRGNDYGRLAYSIPLGNDGWRTGVNVSHLQYDLVASDFKGLDANGSSTSYGLDANYPLIRSRLQNLYLGLNYAHKRFDNEANQATTSNYDINNVSISLNGNQYDKLGGGGANAAGLALSHGSVELGSLDLAEDAGLEGGFSKLNYYLSRQQLISDRISAFAGITGQAANEDLDSAEKFYLGGAYGVRAYPANEGGGVEGQLVNLELRGRLPLNLILTGFYDWGHVRINQDNTSNTSPNSYNLKGAGMALAWRAKEGLKLQATWARRIGDNPNPTATGADQDGSLDKNRWWLTAGLSF